MCSLRKLHCWREWQGYGQWLSLRQHAVLGICLGAEQDGFFNKKITLFLLSTVLCWPPFWQKCMQGILYTTKVWGHYSLLTECNDILDNNLFQLCGNILGKALFSFSMTVPQWKKAKSVSISFSECGLEEPLPWPNPTALDGSKCRLRPRPYSLTSLPDLTDASVAKTVANPCMFQTLVESLTRNVGDDTAAY